MTIKSTKRATYTPTQKDVLEATFRRSPYPTTAERENLADRLSVSADQIGNWFKNNRARLFREVSNSSSTPVRTCHFKKRRIIDLVSIKEEPKAASPITIMSSDAESDSDSTDDDSMRLQIVTDNESEGHPSPNAHSSNLPPFTNTSGWFLKMKRRPILTCVCVDSELSSINVDLRLSADSSGMWIYYCFINLTFY